MKASTLRDAIKLAERLDYILVSTVGEDGAPHLAVAGEISLESDMIVGVTAWFCPETVTNLQKNPSISLVIWDSEADSGYQLVGETQQIVELAFMDGYIPGKDESLPSPQVERKLIVRVNKILEFKHAPHNDIELT